MISRPGVLVTPNAVPPVTDTQSELLKMATPPGLSNSPVQILHLPAKVGSEVTQVKDVGSGLPSSYQLGDWPITMP
jgi:hypothetical protein